MMNTKILIAGIGGIGGYFGGLLAKHYYDNKNINIHFYARGAHLNEIQKNGLKVIQGEIEFISKPTVASDNPTDIGVVDFVIVATKSYDLEAVIQQLGPCINRETIILPLLNGVDNKERIKNLLPDNITLDGCAYIVSRLKQDGVVENKGNIQTIFFGLDHITTDRFQLLEALLKKAKIEATLTQDISRILWEKFIFISPTATATSYFDSSIGELISDKIKLLTTLKLVEEVTMIAKAKNILVPDDIVEKTLNKLKALPFETTSSMHSDFKNKKPKNELQSLTSYVLSEGQKHDIKTPTYHTLYQELKKKTGL